MANNFNPSDGSGGFSFGGTVTGTVFYADAGSASAPGFAFTGDTDTGVYRAGTNAVAFSAGGSAAAPVRAVLSNSGRYFSVEGDGTSRMDIRILSQAKANTSEMASCQYWGVNSSDSAFPYAQFLAKVSSNTAGAEQGQFNLEVADSGSVDARFSIVGSNAGIGTTTPTFTSGSGLEIQRAGANATLRAERITSSTSAVELRAGASQGELYTTSNNILVIGTNSITGISIGTDQIVDLPVGGTIVSERAHRGAAVYKSTDESINNSTTLQNDDELSVSLAASAKYWFRFYLFTNNAAALEGIKLGLNGTAGVSALKAQITIYDDTTNAIVAFGRVTAFGSSVAAGLSSGDNVSIIEGSISTSTAGTFLLQWAQNVSGGGASATTVQAGSALVVVRLP